MQVKIVNRGPGAMNQGSWNEPVTKVMDKTQMIYKTISNLLHGRTEQAVVSRPTRPHGVS